jgi:putative membrane protein
MALSWLWDLLFGLAVLGKGCWYFAENPSRLGVSKGRQSSMGLGLTLAFILLVGPISHAAIHTFWIHMVQHVGLMMLISPLIVLGSPGKVALNSRFTVVARMSSQVSRNVLVRQLFRPQVGFVIFLGTLIVTHFSPLANAGMINPNWHCVELMLFIFAGVIYYYPVLEGNPTPFPVPYFARVLSLFAMMLPETMTGFFLYSGNSLLHSIPQGMSTMSGMTDQHRGGAIMWAMGMLIDAIWIMLAARDWFLHEKKLSEEQII